MLDYIFLILIILPFVLLLWLMVLNLIKITFDNLGFDLDFTNIFNRKVVDIPDFVNTHNNSEIEYLFNERRKNDNEI